MPQPTVSSDTTEPAVQVGYVVTYTDDDTGCAVWAVVDALHDDTAEVTWLYAQGDGGAAVADVAGTTAWVATRALTVVTREGSKPRGLPR